MFDDYVIKWDTNTICGWEPDKNIILIDAIQRGIKLEDKFEPLNLAQLGENEYSLLPLEIATPRRLAGGGHNRTVGHLYSNKEMNCRIYQLDLSEISFIKRSGSFMNISHTKIFNHKEIANDKMKAYETKIFFERALRYPRIDWKKWGIEPPKEWLKKYGVKS